jgi:phosphocarrier protein HPr
MSGMPLLEAGLKKIEVFEQEFIVANKLGIHARVAAQIVKVASQFESEVWIAKGGSKANGKSILDVMTLVCPLGSRVQVSAIGSDAVEALNALAVLFQTKFGEP